MGLCAFLSELRHTGRVKVPPRLGSVEDEAIAALEVLREMDRDVRSELAYEAPPFRESSAGWAAVHLYRLCQLLVFREPDSSITQALSQQCPEPKSAAVDYSVDFTFCFLSDLQSLVRSATATQVLHQELMRFARAWPLSSVGIDQVGDVNVDSFIESQCLRQLYVDRIIARRDMARAVHPLVRDAIRQSLGLYRDLAPAVADSIALEEPA